MTLTTDAIKDRQSYENLIAKIKSVHNRISQLFRYQQSRVIYQ